jgi:hypothetical protein
MIFAMYFLFADTSFTHRVISFWNDLTSGLISFKRKRLQFNIKNLLIIGAVFLLSYIIINRLTYLDDFFRHVFWSVYSIIFITLFLISVLKGSYNNEKGSLFSLPHFSFVLFPIIVFFNGLSPYLGLKTEYSFAMFSNLRTEGGISNHFIMSSDWQIFNFQDDLVEIISSSEYELQDVADENRLMVFFMFRDIVARIKPENVEYIRNGEHQTYSISEASSTKELRSSNPYLLRKFLDFRTIKKNEPQPCTH